MREGTERLKNYYGKKVKLDGYTFDSRKEASFYAAYIKSCGKKYQVHPQCELLPIYNAKSVLAESTIDPTLLCMVLTGP